MGETTSERLASQNLPSLQPSAVIVLQRTQTTLGILRDVVQESSAEYWYRRGKEAAMTEEWPAAIHAFRRCLNCDSQHWRATLQLAAALIVGINGPNQGDPALLALQQIFKQPIPLKSIFAAELPKATWEKLRFYLGAGVGNGMVCSYSYNFGGS